MPRSRRRSAQTTTIVYIAIIPPLPFTSPPLSYPFSPSREGRRSRPKRRGEGKGPGGASGGTTPKTLQNQSRAGAEKRPRRNADGSRSSPRGATPGQRPQRSDPGRDPRGVTPEQIPQRSDPRPCEGQGLRPRQFQFKSVARPKRAYHGAKPPKSDPRAGHGNPQKLPGRQKRATRAPRSRRHEECARAKQGETNADRREERRAANGEERSDEPERRAKPRPQADEGRRRDGGAERARKAQSAERASGELATGQPDMV